MTITAGMIYLMFSAKLFVVCLIAVKHKSCEWLYTEWALSEEGKLNRWERNQAAKPKCVFVLCFIYELQAFDFDFHSQTKMQYQTEFKIYVAYIEL